MEEIIRLLKEDLIGLNRKKLKVGFILNEIYDLLEEDPDYQEAYGNFKQFLADPQIAISFKQVKPLMTATKWCKDNHLQLEDVQDIPLSKLNILYKNEVPLDEETLYELRELSYTDLNIKYGSKAEYEYDR